MAFCSTAEKIIKCLLEFLHLSSPTVEQINSNFLGCFVDVDIAFTQTFSNKSVQVRSLVKITRVTFDY